VQHLAPYKLVVTALAVVTLGVLIFIIKFAVQSGDQQITEASYPIKKHLRYGFTLRNTSDQFIKHSTFQAFAPVRQTSSQLVESLHSSHPYTMTEDQFGNQVMNFSIDSMPPFGTKVITITAAMLFSNTPNQLQVDEETYLANSDLLNINHPMIVDTATATATGTNGTVNDIGKAVYQWVSTHIRYSGFEAQDKGALYAVQSKSGDCTEFSQLTTSLLRQQKVPARTVGGFVTIKTQQVLRASDYHNWSEYRDANSWILADAQKKVHNEAYEEYIAFRIIEKEEGNPMSNSHRFLAFDQRLAVSMN
jgi:hypothetical protein